MNTTTGENSTEEEEGGHRIPIQFIIPLVIFVTIAVTMAVGGNLLVIVAYCRDQRLRTVNSLYLVNLAAIDFVIGAIIMPVYLYYTMWSWPLGRIGCKIYSAADYTICEMSLLLVILVDLDRFASVQRGALYFVSETKRKAYMKVAACWMFSVLFFALPTLLWDIIRGTSELAPYECDVEFKEEFAIVLAQEIVSLAIPVISLPIIHIRLLLALKKRGDQVFDLQSNRRLDANPAQSVLSAESCGPLQEEPDPRNLSNEGKTQKRGWFPLKTSPSDKVPSTYADNPHVTLVQSSKRNAGSPIEFGNRGNISVYTLKMMKRMNRRGRDRRAGMSLSLLIIAIIICWFPYSIVTVIRSQCEACVDHGLYEAFVWLLWFKSSVNPFLYAYRAPRFRRNIHDLLICTKKQSRTAGCSSFLT